jgi:hypothetical protein
MKCGIEIHTQIHCPHRFVRLSKLDSVGYPRYMIIFYILLSIELICLETNCHKFYVMDILFLRYFVYELVIDIKVDITHMRTGNLPVSGL